MARFNGANYTTPRNNGQLLSYKVRPALVQYLTQSTAPTTAGIGSVAPSGNVPMQYCVKYCECHSKLLGNATQVRQGNPFKGPIVPLSIGVTHRWCCTCNNWVLLQGYYHIMPPQATLPPGKQAYNGNFISGTATVGTTHCANPSNRKV